MLRSGLDVRSTVLAALNKLQASENFFGVLDG